MILRWNNLYNYIKDTRRARRTCTYKLPLQFSINPSADNLLNTSYKSIQQVKRHT